MSHSRWKRNCREGTGSVKFGLAPTGNQKQFVELIDVWVVEESIHCVLVRDDAVCGFSIVPGAISFLDIVKVFRAFWK